MSCCTKCGTPVAPGKVADADPSPAAPADAGAAAAADAAAGADDKNAAVPLPVTPGASPAPNDDAVSQGLLDAFDVTSLTCCSWDLFQKTSQFWKGVRAGNPTTRLLSVERLVEDPAQNDTRHLEYVPVSAAGKCVDCSLVTRFQHPIEGSMLCAPCGVRSVNVGHTSPMFQFSLVSENNAKKLYGFSDTADLGKQLRFCLRRAWFHDPKDTSVCCHTKYAPEFASDAASVLKEHKQNVARPSARIATTVAAARVFSTRDIICLLLERFGGPYLLNERIRNCALPALDPAKPDD